MWCIKALRSISSACSTTTFQSMFRRCATTLFSYWPLARWKQPTTDVESHIVDPCRSVLLKVTRGGISAGAIVIVCECNNARVIALSVCLTIVASLFIRRWLFGLILVCCVVCWKRISFEGKALAVINATSKEHKQNISLIYTQACENLRFW